MNIQGKKFKKNFFPDFVRFAHNPLRNFVATWVFYFGEMFINNYPTKKIKITTQYK